MTKWFLLLLWAGSASATTVYYWVDSSGNRTFADTPPPLGKYEKLEYTAPTPSPIIVEEEIAADAIESSDTDPTIEPESKSAPTTITLTSPTESQTIRNNAGQIDIAVTSDKPIEAPYSLQLLVDNAGYGPATTALNWSVTGVVRGPHTLQVALLKNGRQIASSSKVVVYLHRSSSLMSPAMPR